MDVIKTAKFFSKHPEPALSEAEEQDLIAQAQAGDSEAFRRIVSAYAPLILSMAPRKPTEDDSQTIAIALVDALNSFDPSRAPRLGGILRWKIADERHEATRYAQVVPVPPGTAKRYRRIMHECDGDFAKALEQCGTFGMSRDTLTMAHDALRWGVEFSEADWDQALSEEADGLLVDAALDALDPRETVVVLRSYGFVPIIIDGIQIPDLRGGAPHPAGVVAPGLGLRRSRVNELRLRALHKMRVKLVKDFGVLIKDIEDPEMEEAA